MRKLRYWVPAGKSLLQARLQFTLPSDDETWYDVPTIYQSEDDEVIPCPLEENQGAYSKRQDTLCAVCFGEGQGRRGDIQRRMAELTDFHSVNVEPHLLKAEETASKQRLDISASVQRRLDENTSVSVEPENPALSLVPLKKAAASVEKEDGDGSEDAVHGSFEADAEAEDAAEGEPYVEEQDEAFVVLCTLLQRATMEIPIAWLKKALFEGFEDVPHPLSDDAEAMRICVVHKDGAVFDLSHIQSLVVEWEEKLDIES